MKKRLCIGNVLFCLSFLFLIPLRALSDDAAVSVYGGAAALRDPKSTDISMLSEVVRISLGANDYHVEATFEFFNHGPTTTISVGFPSTGHPFSGELENFHTWVNGREVAFEKMPEVIEIDGKDYSPEELPSEEDRLDYDPIAWLVKTVAFPGNEKTVTRVEYNAPYGIWSVGTDKFAEYFYGTGKSWKGDIGRATFVIEASPTVRIVAKDLQNLNNSFKVSRRSNGSYKLSQENFKPQGHETLFITLAPESNARGGGTVPKFCDWAYSKQIIPDEVLEPLSDMELRIFRNSFYAAHGQVFKSPALNEYFKAIPCYQPHSDFKESDLNDTEKSNIKKIADYEKKLKEQLLKK